MRNCNVVRGMPVAMEHARVEMYFFDFKSERACCILDSGIASQSRAVACVVNMSRK